MSFKIITNFNLGETIIIHALSCSAYFILNGSPRYFSKTIREGSASVHFLNSQALENTVNFFQLDINPEKLRELFFKKIEQVQNGK